MKKFIKETIRILMTGIILIALMQIMFRVSVPIVQDGARSALSKK